MASLVMLAQRLERISNDSRSPAEQLEDRQYTINAIQQSDGIPWTRLSRTEVEAIRKALESVLEGDAEQLSALTAKKRKLSEKLSSLRSQRKALNRYGASEPGKPRPAARVV